MIFDKVPLMILSIYGIVSLLTFLIYAVDKSAAKKGGWRIKESTLHLLSFTGGWLGALVAQKILRHKTRKQPFRFIFLGNHYIEYWCISYSVSVHKFSGRCFYFTMR